MTRGWALFSEASHPGYEQINLRAFQFFPERRHPAFSAHHDGRQNCIGRFIPGPPLRVREIRGFEDFPYRGVAPPRGAMAAGAVPVIELTHLPATPGEVAALFPLEGCAGSFRNDE